MRVLIVAVKTISLNIKLSKFELKIHIHTLFACIFTATEYFLYYFFKNPTVFIKLLTKSHYVDQSVTCYLHMNYIENKKKLFVSPIFFHFPITLDRIPIWGWGWGCVHAPSFYWSNKGNIHIFYIFFFRWLSLISMMSVTHTAKSPCSTVYLFHFVPVIHVTFIIFFIFFNVQSKGYLPLKIDLYTQVYRLY